MSSCPTCGSPMNFYSQENLWYCDVCMAYKQPESAFSPQALAQYQQQQQKPQEKPPTAASPAAPATSAAPAAAPAAPAAAPAPAPAAQQQPYQYQGPPGAYPPQEPEKKKSKKLIIAVVVIVIALVVVLPLIFFGLAYLWVSEISDTNEEYYSFPTIEVAVIDDASDDRVVVKHIQGDELDWSKHSMVITDTSDEDNSATLNDLSILGIQDSGSTVTIDSDIPGFDDVLIKQSQSYEITIIYKEEQKQVYSATRMSQ